MSRLFLPLLLFCPAILAVPLHADLLKLGDFETGDLTQLRIQQGSPDAVTLVTSPVRAGKHAAKMLLRASDPEVAKGKRAEFIDDLAQIQMDTEYWYGLSLYLPDEFKPPQKRDAVLFQWHTQAGGPSPVLAIRVQGDEWVITSDAIPGGKRRRMKRLPMQKDVWTDWVVHVRWASDATGFWTLWKDGVEVVSEKDIITQYPEKEGPYAKFGQYHSVDETAQNVIYVDEYRVAGPEGSYEKVAPPKAK